MLNETKSKELRRYFEQNQPYSGMALAYLETGWDIVKEVTVEEFTKDVQAKIDDVEKRGGAYFMTLEAALKLLEVAKKLAEYSILDLVIVLGNGVYANNYKSMMSDGSVRLLGACPECARVRWGYIDSEAYDDDATDTYECLNCGAKVLVEEMILTSDDA